MRITKLLRISSFQIIIGSFLAVILTGTFLLMPSLPQKALRLRSGTLFLPLLPQSA